MKTADVSLKTDFIWILVQRKIDIKKCSNKIEKEGLNKETEVSERQF